MQIISITLLTLITLALAYKLALKRITEPNLIVWIVFTLMIFVFSVSIISTTFSGLEIKAFDVYSNEKLKVCPVKAQDPDIQPFVKFVNGE